MTLDKLLDILIDLKTEHGGDIEVVLPQENLACVRTTKWLADISHVEMGDHDLWGKWGNTEGKVVIF